MKIKLLSFNSRHFSSEETHNYIQILILKIEEVLLNLIISKRYVEERGKYKGTSRIVIDKFKVYYKRIGDEIVIVAIKFPGEN